MHCTLVMGERLGGIDTLLWHQRPLTLAGELGAPWRAHGLGVTPSLAQHPRTALQHGVHRLSRVRRHGLDDLLLAVLQVGLGVGQRHQGGSGCRRRRL